MPRLGLRMMRGLLRKQCKSARMRSHADVVGGSFVSVPRRLSFPLGEVSPESTGVRTKRRAPRHEPHGCACRPRDQMKELSSISGQLLSGERRPGALRRRSGWQVPTLGFSSLSRGETTRKTASDRCSDVGMAGATSIVEVSR
jgi:hypothetical protein